MPMSSIQVDVKPFFKTNFAIIICIWQGIIFFVKLSKAMYAINYKEKNNLMSHCAQH